MNLLLLFLTILIFLIMISEFNSNANSTISESSNVVAESNSVINSINAEMNTHSAVSSTEDDGSLAFLNLPIEDDLKKFNCPVTKQANLANKVLWIKNYIPEVKTRNGLRALIQVSVNADDPSKDVFKFFTSSKELIYVCERLKEMNKFPRKATFVPSSNGCGFVFQ